MKGYLTELAVMSGFATLTLLGWLLWNGQGQLIWLAGYSIICG